MWLVAEHGAKLKPRAGVLVGAVALASSQRLEIPGNADFGALR
jgi:hypothetical protein